MPENAHPPHILLLGESESAVALDRRALRNAGFSDVRLMASGLDACRRLAGIGCEPYLPDAIVCASRLADMDGEQFCAIVRQHPLLLGIPILLILPNENEAAQLKALGCGASALLGRPFSVEDLRKTLASLLKGTPALAQLREAASQADTSAFDAALASYGLLLRPSRQPEDYFKAGMRFLEENNYNFAISAFQHALERARIKGEAELGIAAAYRGKGDSIRYQAWLARASETFVRAKRWHHARSAFARLVQEKQDAKNPFLAEAGRQIRQHEYDEAAKTLSEGLAFIPTLKAGQVLAKVCLGADDSETMLKALQNKLANHGNGENLSSEIKASLVLLARERQERLRQAADERQWQLARAMAKNNEKLQEKQAPAPQRAAGHSNARGPEKRTRVSPLEMIEETGDLDNGVENVPEKDTPILQPLTRPEATSDLFSKSPKLNEFLSVIKLTWKLARRQKK